MRSLLRVLQALGINSVPVLGVLLGGWSTATALLLYWFENLFSALLVALRIARHRRLTRKRGHWLAPVSSRTGRRTAAEPDESTARSGLSSLFGSFLFIALVFTLAHGVFLAVIIFLILPDQFPQAAIVDMEALRRGLLAVAGFLVVGLAIDLVGIERRPFAWIKRVADRVLGRVIVVHLTIIFGMLAMAWLEGPRGLFLVFAGFKTLVDISTVAGDPTPRETPPKWLVAVIRGLGGRAKADDFVGFYGRSHRQEIEQQRQWEETI